MSSEENNHLNCQASEVDSKRANADGEAKHMLDRTEIEALRNLFLLLDQWDRGEASRED